MPFTIKPHSANPYPGRYARHDDIKLYFGIAYGKKVDLEFEGRMMLPLQTIDGEPVYGTVFVPADYEKGRIMRMGKHGRMISSSAHRVRVECPDCQAWVPAGRCHQHKCKGK